MTLKAVDILSKRSKDRDTGFMLMSEAAVSNPRDGAPLTLTC